MSLIAKKNLDLWIVALLIVSLVMYDVTFEILTEILHILFEILHHMFEWVELGIEHAIEHLFHTDRHGSQILTFYTLMLLIAFLLYKLKFVVPLVYNAVRQLSRDAWIRRKTQAKQFWQQQDLAHRIGWSLAACVILYLASFFVM